MGRVQQSAHGDVRRPLCGEVPVFASRSGRLCRSELQTVPSGAARRYFPRRDRAGEIPGKKGKTVVDQDEEPGRFVEEKLRALRPAFGANGTVTAGNASSINDAAAAVVVLSADTAKQLQVKPEFKVLGYATHSREPEWFTIAPVGAIEKLLKQLGADVSKVDLFEINEAFSVVPMAAMKCLGIPHEKVNVHGGAVALGHPIGCSGTRILVTLLNAMKRRKAKLGVASLCIGGGEGVALAVERV